MPNSKKKIKRPLVLIVDDNPDNIKVVGAHLRDEGLEISIALNGEKAISIAKTLKPDLILLDIMMPDMDGLEVCKNLKNDFVTKDIPIIFLTAKVSQEDILIGFETGAVDYVRKPFNSAELLARVNTHLQLKKYRDKIEIKNFQLENLNLEKNELLGITAHDLKNPIYSMSMLAKVIRDEKKLRREEIDEFAQDIVTTAQRMLELISNLLDLNKIEQGEVRIQAEKVDLIELVNRAINIYRERARVKNIDIILETNLSEVFIYADLNATSQILDNIISNAVKYSPFDKLIFISVSNNNKYGRFEVKDQGPGINKEDMKKLFGKFARLSARPTGDEESTGLGLSIVKKYTELMGGRVWCESEDGMGANFIVELPASNNN